MFAPGAKGWIKKYFDLVDRKEVVLSFDSPNQIEKEHFIHLTLSNSGMIFGYPARLIFAKDLDDKDWTVEEKFKLLLFESMLFVYIQRKDGEFVQNEFLEKLYEFYANHNAGGIKKLFRIFVKESREERLEGVLTRRVDIKLNLLENKWWVNSLSNAFACLDVLLFDDFLTKSSSDALKGYNLFAINALNAITLAAYSDGIVEEREKALFNVFLASSNLSEEDRDAAKKRFYKGANLEDFSIFVHDHWLLKRFILDVSILTVLSSGELEDTEEKFLRVLCDYLSIPEMELDENLGLIENFLLRTQGKVEFMKDSPSYEKVYSSLSKRWMKVLVRNKDKIALELKESKDLVFLIKKSATQELSNEEKDLVKTQFKDLVKSVPALAIFLLPGGTVLLPLVMKLIPDLVPSAFKDNEINKEK